MPPNNPLARAVRFGEGDVEELGDMFARLGGPAHPKSPIMGAFKNARRALQAMYSGKPSVSVAGEILTQLERTVRGEIVSALKEAQEAGSDSAGEQLSVYRVRGLRPKPDFKAVNAAYEVVGAKVQALRAAVMANVLTGGDPAMVLGDDNRAGLLSPAPIIAATATWLAIVYWGGWSSTIDKSGVGSGGQWEKMAVAALDHKTTETCLQVHGQTVPMDKPFKLTGTPRFADELDSPPFHHYCRTATVLYNQKFDDGLAGALRDAGRAVLAERAAGENRLRRPANAFP